MSPVSLDLMGMRSPHLLGATRRHRTGGPRPGGVGFPGCTCRALLPCASSPYRVLRAAGGWLLCLPGTETRPTFSIGRVSTWPLVGWGDTRLSGPFLVEPCRSVLCIHTRGLLCRCHSVGTGLRSQGPSCLRADKLRSEVAHGVEAQGGEAGPEQRTLGGSAAMQTAAGQRELARPGGCGLRGL